MPTILCNFLDTQNVPYITIVVSAAAAIRSGILTIPDLSLEMYIKNSPNQIAQAFGHLDPTRQGQRSTKPMPKPCISSSPKSDDSASAIPIDNELVIFVKDFSITRLHVDATGRFPVKSVRGYSFDLLFYVEGSNYIIFTLNYYEFVQLRVIKPPINEHFHSLSFISFPFALFV